MKKKPKCPLCGADTYTFKEVVGREQKMKPTVREELEKIVDNVYYWHPNEYDTISITQATNQILKLIESSLPEEKEYDKEKTNWYAQYSHQGYNQCLAEIKERLCTT